MISKYLNKNYLVKNKNIYFNNKIIFCEIIINDLITIFSSSYEICHSEVINWLTINGLSLVEIKNAFHKYLIEIKMGVDTFLIPSNIITLPSISSDYLEFGGMRMIGKRIISDFELLINYGEESALIQNIMNYLCHNRVRDFDIDIKIMVNNVNNNLISKIELFGCQPISYHSTEDELNKIKFSVREMTMA